MKKILLMDCNCEIRPSIAFLLSLAGYEVSLARGVVEALNRLSLARETSQDYSVLMLNSPGSDEELDFLVEICRRAPIDLPVVFVTRKKVKGFNERLDELRELLPRITLCNHSEVLEHLPRVISGEVFS